VSLEGVRRGSWENPGRVLGGGDKGVSQPDGGAPGQMGNLLASRGIC